MRKKDNEIPHDGGRSIPEWASLDACFQEIGPCQLHEESCGQKHCHQRAHLSHAERTRVHAYQQHLHFPAPIFAHIVFMWFPCIHQRVVSEENQLASMMMLEPELSNSRQALLVLLVLVVVVLLQRFWNAWYQGRLH
jgi:hypothetical protein